MKHELREKNKAAYLKDSKVKRVLYHGTANNIKQFKQIPRKRGFGQAEKPEIYFASADPTVADHFALRNKNDKNFGNTIEFMKIYQT